MAHTNKQHKFNDNDNAHKANVTSYTIIQSSFDIGPGGGGGGSRPPGEIFSKKIKESNASKSDTVKETK